MSLSQLVLINTAIDSINANVLPDSQRLQTLDLTQNKLPKVPTGIFKNTPQLEELFLDQNYIDNVTANAFEGLQSLQLLFLRKNAVRVLEYGAFRSLTNLYRLDLSLNNIATLRCSVDRYSGVFTDLHNINTIDLSLKQVTSIDRCVFIQKGKKTLETLNLSYNDIVSLSTNAFKDLTSLKALILCKSGPVTFIGEGAFSGLTSLGPCDLSPSAYDQKTRMRIATQRCNYHYEYTDPLPQSGLCMSGRPQGFAYCEIPNATTHEPHCTCGNAPSGKLKDGTYQSGTACTCKAGYFPYFAEVYEAYYCAPCPQGTYNSEPGAHECTACPNMEILGISTGFSQTTDDSYRECEKLWGACPQPPGATHPSACHIHPIIRVYFLCGVALFVVLVGFCWYRRYKCMEQAAISAENLALMLKLKALHRCAPVLTLYLSRFDKS